MFELDFTLEKKNLTLIPRAHVTIDFKFLKDLLLSTDLSRLDNLRELGQKNRFLDKTFDMTGNRIAFSSYPRSGNTFLRTFIEQCTGLYTGCDISLSIILTMQMSGMPGEQHYGDDSVWITKTHYPLTNDNCKHQADKIIYLTRNPVEIIPSYAGLMCTTSHSLTPERPWNEYEEFWNFFVDWHSGNIARFFDILQKQSQKTPTFFVRYEDLREDPEPVLRQLFCFMLDVDTIEGTVIDAKLKEVCSTDNTTKARYTLKSNSTNLNRNRALYNEKHWNMLKTRLKAHNYFFGYANMDSPTEKSSDMVPAKKYNTTGFFDYESHSIGNANNFMRYRECNFNLGLNRKNREVEPWGVQYEAPIMPLTQMVHFARFWPHQLRMATLKARETKEIK